MGNEIIRHNSVFYPRPSVSLFLISVFIERYGEAFLLLSFVFCNDRISSLQALKRSLFPMAGLNEATFNAELRMGSGYDPCPIGSYSVFHILCLTIPPEQRPIDSSTGRTLAEIRDFRAVRSTVAVKRWEVTSPAHARPTLAHEAECCFRFCPGGGA